MYLKLIAVCLLFQLTFRGIYAEFCTRVYETECKGFDDTCPAGFTREYYKVSGQVAQCRCVKAREYEDYLACKCRLAMEPCNPDGGNAAQYMCRIAWRDCSDTVKEGLCQGNLTSTKWKKYCCNDIASRCSTLVKRSENLSPPNNTADIVSLCGSQITQCLSNIRIRGFYCPRLASKCNQDIQNAIRGGTLFTSRDNITQLCGSEAAGCLPDDTIERIYCPGLISQCENLIQNSGEDVVKNELDVPQLCGAEITKCLSKEEIRRILCEPRIEKCVALIQNATLAGTVLNSTSQIEQVCGTGITSCLNEKSRDELFCGHLFVRCKLTLPGVISLSFLGAAKDLNEVCGKNVPQSLDCIEKGIFG